MADIPANTVNKAEKEKKVKIPDIKIYLLYGLLVIVLFFVFNAYLKSIKKQQSKDYSSTISYSSVKNNKFGLPRKIFGAFSFSKFFSSNQVNPKKLKSQNLVLNGILISGGNKYALINNNIVREGDKLGDAVVLQINEEYVELKSGTSRFKLKPYTK